VITDLKSIEILVKNYKFLIENANKMYPGVSLSIRSHHSSNNDFEEMLLPLPVIKYDVNNLTQP